MCSRQGIEYRLISLVVALLSFVITLDLGHCESEFAEGVGFIEEAVLRDLPLTTAITFVSQDRAYLALKNGIVRTVKNGQLLPDPFIDISKIVNKGTDRGLLGIAVDPEFPQKPFVYISFVYDPPGAAEDLGDPRVIRVARLTADAAKDYDVALADSLEVIVGKNSTLENMAPPVPAGDPNSPARASCMTGLTMAGDPIEDCVPTDSASHTAGTLIFGSDRSLYASFGDGADYTGPNPVGLRTQNKNSMSGRVIRVNPDTGRGMPDNPFYDASRPNANISKLWSYGFRNPFRITLDPKNGRVFMGDVGTSYYEEVNTGKGANFGWPCYEGGFVAREQQEGEATASIKQVGYKAEPSTIDFCNEMYAQGEQVVTKPIFNYRHPYDDTGKDLGASITGLAFYHGTIYPEQYRDSLFIADYAQHWIRYLTFDSLGKPTVHDFAKETGSNLGVVQLLSGPDSNIYAVYLDLETRTSQVRRFKPTGSASSGPVIRATVSPQAGDVPLVVNVSASKSFDPEGQSLKFKWDFGDGTTLTSADGQHVYEKIGKYTVTVKATQSAAPFKSSTDSFVVMTGVNPPSAHIDSPAAGALFEIGKPVAFSGHAEIPNGALATLTWNLLQIHNQHTHLVGEFEGASGSFIPTEHTENTTFELCLVATSPEGIEDQKCNRLTPRVAKYTFASVPPGAPISYIDEEKDVFAPYIASPIVGSSQSIRAARIFAGRSFVQWSDGVKSAVRNFLTKPSDVVLTAEYKNLRPKAVIGLGLAAAAQRRSRIVVFDASGSRDPEGEALRYSWRFSDGTKARGALVRKKFRRDGRYTAHLTVRDSLGGSTTVTRIVKVKGKRSSRRRR